MEKIFQPIIPPQPSPAAGPRPKFEPEVIVGETCEKCIRGVTYSFLPDPYTGSCELPVHPCGRDEPNEEQDASKLREGINPKILKVMVDRWLAGYPKYLVANRMSLEQWDTVPGEKYLARFEVDAAVIESKGHGSDFRNSAIGGDGSARYGSATSCISRAILACERIQSGNSRHDEFGEIGRADGYNADDDLYGWVSLGEDEVVAFLTKARATGLFLRVKHREGIKFTNGQGDGNEGSQNYHYYYVTIVPPSQIAARERKEQNEQFERMKKEMIKEMLADLESEAEEEEEDEDMNEHEENSEQGYLTGQEEEKSQASAPGKRRNMPQKETLTSGEPEKVIMHQQPEEDGQARQAAQKAQKSPEGHTSNSNGHDKEIPAPRLHKKDRDVSSTWEFSKVADDP
jgi:hypothetical protein